MEEHRAHVNSCEMMTPSSKRNPLHPMQVRYRTESPLNAFNGRYQFAYLGF